ncbi:MAG: ABC transporter permease [Sulfitobacter sp.]
MSCVQTLTDYGLRSIGIGERMLPRGNFTLCEQFTLIGSGLIWNVYFGVVALAFGFFFATALAMGKASANPWLQKPARWFIFVFRGSPLFIQFFFGYFLFSALKSEFAFMAPFTAAWLGALVVLFFNTSAYSAEIFYGALQSIPKGEVEAADAYGMSGWPRFKRIIWPTMLRLAWPSYTNEAIFLFHATTLVFMTGFPTWQQRGDALYYASYIADKTYNPFIPYPILALYFIILSLGLIGLFGIMNKYLNKHLPVAKVQKLRLRLNLIR